MRVRVRVLVWLGTMCGAALLMGSGCGAQVRYPADPATTVRLPEGALEGASPAPGVRAYLGIPYAKAPVGELRWRPPQAFGALAVEGQPRLAVSHGNPCPQQDAGWNHEWVERGNEDCLFLNVWAPAAGAGHAVMVYLHGGSNVAGSAAEELSNGLELAPRGVVLVTLDYRLGVFGFLRTPGLDAETAYHGSGDYGLMDQVAALGWVRDHIAAFGGDPTRVTIFGESAGAVDVGLLMTSPPARGLFARALEESGQVVGLMPTASREESEAAWAPLGKTLGAEPAAMRRASTAEVMAAERALPKAPAERPWGSRGASVDGYVLPMLPAQVFARGREAPVPLLLGSNVQEIVPAQEDAGATRRGIRELAGAKLAPVLQAIYAQPAAEAMEGGAGARFLTDRDFRCAVRQVALWHAGHGFRTFVYQFDRSAGSAAPARHASELRFVFGLGAAGGLRELEASADDMAVSREVETYWTSFARTGTPAPGAGMPIWPAFVPEVGDYLHFVSPGLVPVVAEGLGGASCALLAGELLPGSH